MELAQALEAARANHQSVLTTIRRDGRPQLSNVLHWAGDDGLIRVSTTADRAKHFGPQPTQQRVKRLGQHEQQHSEGGRCQRVEQEAGRLTAREHFMRADISRGAATAQFPPRSW